MYVSAEIHELIRQQGDVSTDNISHYAQLRADLERFVTGKFLTVAHLPFKKEKDSYLAKVHPPERNIWAIRSLKPKPGIRVLGCFAKRDVFIALEWAARSDLGGKAGVSYKKTEWAAFIGRCSTHWSRLFYTFKPLAGDKTSDFLSENFLDV